MTTDISKKRSASNTEQAKLNKRSEARSSSGIKKADKSKDRRVTGYTRVKSGDLKRRTVSRTPDMSRPNARVINPSFSLGALTSVQERPVALAANVEPTVRTITDSKKVSFPYSIVFLSLICSILFMYMIFNYVQINEQTSTVSNLKSEIATLSTEKDNLSTKLDRKNDLTFIEKVAREELGMVKIDEITKKYIIMDPGDSITNYKDTAGSETGK